ncbi:hypothetical protein GCM10009569_06020 [Arthrobacter russicus]
MSFIQMSIQLQPGHTTFGELRRFMEAVSRAGVVEDGDVIFQSEDDSLNSLIEVSVNTER